VAAVVQDEPIAHLDGVHGVDPIADDQARVPDGKPLRGRSETCSGLNFSPPSSRRSFEGDVNTHAF